MEPLNDLALNWNEFTKVDMRIGTIRSAEDFNEAINPSYRLVIDFGPLGLKKSSAQITDLYCPENLIGRQIIAVVNFPPKQIANMMSDCLVLGGVGDRNVVTLISPERKLENGTKIG